MDWLLACILLAVVFAAILHQIHRQRSLAERGVDLLYHVAMVAVSMARAADAALVRYRATRHEIRQSHVPDYAEAGNAIR